MAFLTTCLTKFLKMVNYQLYKNADGSPVNLFEQELIALRVTMDVAFHIADDKAFAKLTAGTVSTGGNTETV